MSLRTRLTSPGFVTALVLGLAIVALGWATVSGPLDRAATADPDPFRPSDPSLVATTGLPQLVEFYSDT